MNRWMNERMWIAYESIRRNTWRTLTKCNGVWCHEIDREKKYGKKERWQCDNTKKKWKKIDIRLCVYVWIHTCSHIWWKNPFLCYGFVWLDRIMASHDVWINVVQSRCVRAYLEIILFQFVWRWISRYCYCWWWWFNVCVQKNGSIASNTNCREKLGGEKGWGRDGEGWNALFVIHFRWIADQMQCLNIFTRFGEHLIYPFFSLSLSLYCCCNCCYCCCCCYDSRLKGWQCGVGGGWCVNLI